MARKYDFISELYNRTCKMVVANPESWEAFLRYEIGRAHV